MKVKILDKILNYKNEPVTERRVGKDGKAIEYEVTFLDIFDFVINNTMQGEVRTAEDKSKAFGLSKKLYGAKDFVELSGDEITYIKNRTDKMDTLTPLVVGRINEILFPDVAQPPAQG